MAGGAGGQRRRCRWVEVRRGRLAGGCVLHLRRATAAGGAAADLPPAQIEKANGYPPIILSFCSLTIRLVSKLLTHSYI